MKMFRDSRAEWPADQPPGAFDIELGTVSGYASAAHMIFVCPNGKRCTILIGPKHVSRSSPDRLCVWKWDGNIDAPTISPSINCIAEKDGKPTGGCGWHGFIKKGDMA